MTRSRGLRAVAVVSVLAAVGGLAAWQALRPPRPTNPADSPAVARAAANINLEVQAWQAGPTAAIATEYKYALSTMNYVQSRLSSAKRSRLKALDPLHLPGSTDACLDAEAGICGNHVQAFEDLLAATGADVRRRAVEFYLHDEARDKNRNHVTAEVYWGGAWHYFDVTWGTYFVRPGATAPDDILSAAEVRGLIRAGRPWRELAVTNGTNPWYRYFLAAGRDPFEHLHWPDTDVLSDGPATVRLRPNSVGDGYSLQNLPSAVGHVREYCKNPRQVEFRLDPAALNPTPRVLEIEVGGVSDPAGDAALVVRAGSTVLHNVRLSETRDRACRVNLTEAGEVTIRVESESKAGHARLKGVRRGAD